MFNQKDDPNKKGVISFFRTIANNMKEQDEKMETMRKRREEFEKKWKIRKKD